MNKWVIMGNLGHDPKAGTSQSGVPLCYMDVAVSANNGQSVQWVSVTAFRQVAENCLKYLHKGSKIVCGGAANVRSWQGNDGSARCGLTMAADFVEFAGGNTAAAEAAPAAAEAPAAAAQQGYTQVDDEETPF